MKVGDLVRRNQEYKGSSPIGAIGIILAVDCRMLKVSNHGWWSEHTAEVISEQKIRNR
jgi:hypothetical protein